MGNFLGLDIGDGENDFFATVNLITIKTIPKDFNITLDGVVWN